MGTRRKIINAVMTAPAMSSVVISVAVTSSMLLRSCRPMAWAIRMVPPVHRPTTILVRIKVIWLPMFTPDILMLPAKLPTMSISATLYRDWIRLEARKGRANKISCRVTLPSVRFRS